MATCTISRSAGVACLAVAGRIDSISSPDIQRRLEEMIMDGERRIAVDLAGVPFLSSAGLRVFLIAQKALARVGGEILLCKVPEGVMRVLIMTGFDRILRIGTTEAEFDFSQTYPSAAGDRSETRAGVSFTLRERPEAAPGMLRLIGSQDKFATADYDQEDMITLPQRELLYGAGLATIGDDYEEYKGLFGEAVLLNHNLYFYPAVKRPAADFMLHSGDSEGTGCHFLNGFAFDGVFRYLAAFDGFITLDLLLEWLLTLPLSAPLLGIVLIAESKGILGMNLKQVPLRENRPEQDFDLYSVAHVASWINFPVDPADPNHVIAAAGIICRDRAACPAAVQKLFTEKSTVHLHAGIFAKGPVSKNLDHFLEELDRILTELDVFKVQHLLGGSRFSNGMLGIIELKG
ncbi:MAG TPA: STAS domain-containing protein [bacterium]|nr:STAS domain-containing protein [bacterium]